MASLFKRTKSWLVIGLALVSFGITQSAEAARGRPILNSAKSTFVADNGQPLRGPLISTESGSLPSRTAMQAAKNYGCNAIHCYAENAGLGYAAGTQAATLDQVVQWTRDDGLYLIITIGGGGVNSSFVNSFWNFYAGRYANETHVIYEIQNEPVRSPGVSSDVLTMEQSAYNIIKSSAPNTPTLLFTYMCFENGSKVIQDINALTGVNWNKTAIAFHGYGTGGRNTCRSTMQYVVNAGYPIFMTEFYTWPWGMGVNSITDSTAMYQDVSETGDCERLGVSWLTFITTGVLTNDARFKTPLTNAGILWKPDYGTWPSGSRGTYGNNGEPWSLMDTTSTLHIEAENYDNGGQGISYNDTESTNYGGQYRTNYGVDVQATTDTNGGYNVGWFNSGEWLEYTIYVDDAGLYDLKLRVASPQASNSLQVSFGGVDATGTWTFAGTGGNQTWTTVTKTVSLTPGQQIMRITAQSTGVNLNWIELTGVTTGKVANGTYKVVNRNSGLVLDVVDHSTADGAKIQQWAYGGSSNQQWVLTHLGANEYKITSYQTGKSIDIPSLSRTNGTQLQVWSYSGTQNQKFILTPTSGGYYKIIPVHSGLVFDVTNKSTSNGALIQQYQDGGTSNQEWSFQAP